jgi:hypothetical protein
VIYNNPFQPFLAVDNDDTTVRSRQADAFRPFAPFTSRTALATKALDQAERDLEGARNRASVADEKRREKLEHEATMAEKKRIVAILTSPVAARLSSLAKRVAIESNSPAHEAIEALEQYERESAANSAKAASDLIILAGRKARGELPCDVNAGPKTPIKATAESILAAACGSTTTNSSARFGLAAKCGAQTRSTNPAIS